MSRQDTRPVRKSIIIARRIWRDYHWSILAIVGIVLWMLLIPVIWPDPAAALSKLVLTIQ